MKDLRDLILELLTLVDYKDDKESFTDEFLENLKREAMLNSINRLPQEEADELKKQIQTSANEDEKLKLLRNKISKDIFQEEFNNLTVQKTKEFFEEPIKNLPEDKKTDLQKIFREYQNPATTIAATAVS